MREPDFKYFSKRTVSGSLRNSIDTTIDQGRSETVWPDGPWLGSSARPSEGWLAALGDFRNWLIREAA